MVKVSANSCLLRFKNSPYEDFLVLELGNTDIIMGLQ